MVLSPEDIQKTVRDSLYIGLGLGVMAFQRAQVQRQEFRKQFSSQVREAQQAVADNVRTVEERLEAIEERIDAALDDVEGRLPEPSRTALSQARAAAKDARSQLRQLPPLGRRPATER